MIASRQSPHGLTVCRGAVLLAAWSLSVAAGWATAAQAADPGTSAHTIFRFDPMLGMLVPIPPEELKAGYAYNHFNSRLNRRVWSYVRSNGEFWYALGEGTTLEAWRLDIRATMAQRTAKLDEMDAKLANQLRKSGRRVTVRLNGHGRWELADARAFEKIYNAETGQRWEKHYGGFVPVISTYSDRWAVRGGKYVPIGSRPTYAAASGCGCPACSH